MVESMVELNEIANETAVAPEDKEVKVSGASNMNTQKPSGASTTMTKFEEENDQNKVLLENDANDVRESFEAMLPKGPAGIVAQHTRRYEEENQS